MAIPISVELLKALHESVLEDDPKAVGGYRQESMIDCCCERPMRKVYGYVPFPDMVDRAAALMFSINAFHPFIDGCKRTSLLATYFFLLFNGIQFEITRDMIDLTIKIADRKIMDEAIVSARLRPYCRKNLVLTFYSKAIFPLIHTGIHKNEVFITVLIIPLIDYTRKIWPRA